MKVYVLAIPLLVLFATDPSVRSGARLDLALTPAQSPIVSVDTHALVEGGFAEEDARRLQEELVGRLADEGYVVAPGADRVALRLTVRPDDTGWSVEAKGSRVETYHVNPAPTPVVSLEILQRAIMALDAIRDDLVTPETHEMSRVQAVHAAPLGPSIEPRDVDVDERARSTPPVPQSWHVDAAASTGIFARDGGVDPMVQANVDLRPPSAFGARLRAAVDWSNNGGALSITEWQAQIGPTWSISIDHSPLVFTTAALAGILLHHYSYGMLDSGERTDWNLALPVDLSYRWGWATLGAGLLAGISQNPRQHEISGSLAWHRGAAFVGAALGLGVVL